MMLKNHIQRLNFDLKALQKEFICESYELEKLQDS
jgi:hypothetical protein